VRLAIHLYFFYFRDLLDLSQGRSAVVLALPRGGVPVAAEVAKEAAFAVGVSCETMHVEDDQPYLAIIETAARKSCDLIVMAPHGRHGISAIVHGSETVKVLTHSIIPVLVVRAPHQGVFTALVVDLMDLGQQFDGARRHPSRHKGIGLR
jgi:nucleotide-binding universal stress UspA family protein